MATLNYETAGRFRDVAGIRRRHLVHYTGPASYPAGGDPLTPTDVGLGTIEFLGAEHAFHIWNGSAVRICIYDVANEVLRIYIPNTGAEVAGAVDLSAFVGRFEVCGM